MRFDAYAASVRDVEFPRVVDTLAASLGAMPYAGKPMRRYGQVVRLDKDGTLAGWVGWDTANGMVFLEGKGQHTPAWVKSTRAHFPHHTVARADVCEDYNDPQAFGQLIGTIKKAKGPKVWSGFVALPDDESEGRTWAAGKRGNGSPAYIRVYEAGKHPDRVHLAMPDLVRFEAEFHPHYAADKAKAATLQPIEFFGLSAWTQRVGEAVTQCPIERFEAPIRQFTHDKTTLYLARTFARFWETSMADGIDWYATVREILAEDARVAEEWQKANQRRGRAH